jgi:hypothetical protein
MFGHGYAHYMKHAFPMVRVRSWLGAHRRPSARAVERVAVELPCAVTVSCHLVAAQQVQSARYEHSGSLSLCRLTQDNLLPISCTGKDWQGGLAVTLVDSLDALLVRRRVPYRRAPPSHVATRPHIPSCQAAAHAATRLLCPCPQVLNRREDMVEALRLVREQLHFDKDIKVPRAAATNSTVLPCLSAGPPGQQCCHPPAGARVRGGHSRAGRSAQRPHAAGAQPARAG